MGLVNLSSVRSLNDQVGSIASKFQNLFLLIIRLYWGWSFFQAGKGKFGDPEKVIGFFTGLGIPFPTFNLYLVATVETFGGLLLLLGIVPRLASIPLIITMIVAYTTAHAEALHGIFSDPNTFFGEAPFLFLYASLIVLLFGPGSYTLGGVIKKFKSK